MSAVHAALMGSYRMSNDESLHDPHIVDWTRRLSVEWTGARLIRNGCEGTRSPEASCKVTPVGLCRA
jgi:hypothetical protein